MKTKTKVICTLGPAVDSYEKVLALAAAGMDVARINCSHGTHKEHAERIAHVKKAREELNLPIAIMLDTKGPEIRIGELKDQIIKVKKGDRITLGSSGDGTNNQVAINPPSILENLTIGTPILFNDGYILSKIIEKKSDQVVVEIANDGVLASRKGVNIPHADLNLPAMTEADKKDLTFACQQEVDLIAASFIRSAEHLLEIKSLLAKEGREDILVIAKIENNQGVENFDQIVIVADGVMIARGDLGVELDLGTIPRLQKMMIRKCFAASKPAIIATQMLESMIANPRPTRAEVSDVANAIDQSASGVMLSAETAVGKYPIEALLCMKRVLSLAEREDFNYREFFEHHAKRDFPSVSSSIAMAAVSTSYSCGAKTIIACTTSGFTARNVSRFRPAAPIIALTTSKRIYHQLAFYWGVYPVYQPEINGLEDAFKKGIAFALSQKFLSFGDLVVITAGSIFGTKGSTNMLLVESVGNVLIRGHKGIGKKCSGRIRKIVDFRSPEEIQPDTILLTHKCDGAMHEMAKKAAGIILDASSKDIESENLAITLGRTYQMAVILRAENAMKVLTNDQIVTIDPQKGLIYAGKEQSK
jgi:pyruvate kinase